MTIHDRNIFYPANTCYGRSAQYHRPPADQKLALASDGVIFQKAYGRPVHAHRRPAGPKGIRRRWMPYRRGNHRQPDPPDSRQGPQHAGAGEPSIQPRRDLRDPRRRRQDFSKTTIFTTLSPCDVCATLIYMRQFSRVVVGDVTNASGNEQMLRDKGVQVDILEDQMGIELYASYRRHKPDQDLEDWKGLAAVRKS